jgi:hypothetical protein
MERYRRSSLQRFYSEGHHGSPELYIDSDIEEEPEVGREADLEEETHSVSSEETYRADNDEEEHKGTGESIDQPQADSPSPYFSTPKRTGRRHSSFASNLLSSIGSQCQRQSRKFSANLVLGGSEKCLSQDNNCPDNRLSSDPVSARKVSLSTPSDIVKTPGSGRKGGGLMRRSASSAFSKGRKLSGLLAHSLPRRFVKCLLSRFPYIQDL